MAACAQQSAPAARAGAADARGVVRPDAGVSRCRVCAEAFASVAEFRAHWKSDRHLYNMKGAGLGQQPLTAEMWEAKARSEMEARALQKPVRAAEVVTTVESETSDDSDLDDLDTLSESESVADDSEGDCDELALALGVWGIQEHVGPDLDESGQLCLPGGARAVCRGQGRGRLHSRRSAELAKWADPDELRMALERRAASLAARRANWLGVVQAAETRQGYAPRRDLPVVAIGAFDGGCKTNNERGHQCYGQGKRHQNAPVHGQPKKHGGKLAKWSSAPAPKPRGSASGVAAGE